MMLNAFVRLHNPLEQGNVDGAAMAAAVRAAEAKIVALSSSAAPWNEDKGAQRAAVELTHRLEQKLRDVDDHLRRFFLEQSGSATEYTVAAAFKELAALAGVR
jgi:hypothetical protein